MPVNSFSCHIQQARWKAPSPSLSPSLSPGKYSLSFWLQNTELWVPDLQVFQRSPLIPQSICILKILGTPLFSICEFCKSSYWSTSMMLPGFSGKIPLPLSSFLLPYSLICFIFNYLYRRDQQFTNNGIKPAKLPKVYRILKVLVRITERGRSHTPIYYIRQLVFGTLR